MIRLRVSIAAAACALLCACGGGGGDDAAPGVAPPGAVAASFGVQPARVKLGVGDDYALFTVAAPGAVTWSSSDTAVATVDADGNVHALAKGSAAITATAQNGTASAAVTIYLTRGATADPTSEALIAQALAGGAIDAEQALVYRVYAQLGDSRLPAAYDGAPNAAPDHMILREASGRLPTLSAATQELLRPFFVPPIYPQSWHAQRLVAIAPAAAAGQVRAQSANKRGLGTEINCEAQALPDYYRRLSTAHFNIFYLELGMDPAYDSFHSALALSVASVIEEVFNAETGLLGRYPKADTGLPCNGGDGATDIYLGSLEPRTVGQTVPYAGSCSDTSSFIVMNSDHWAVRGLARLAISSPGQVREAVKSLLAHEVLHVLQLAMSRAESCADLRWFDEATAEWAMDFVVPTIASSSSGEPGLEDGLNKVGSFQYAKKRSGEFLAEYLFSGHMRSIEQGKPAAYGYSDYLFFQYLARKHSPQTIEKIYDSMAAGFGNLEAIADAVDMKTVWPEFALTLWNDGASQVLDYWKTEDKYDFGLWDVYTHNSYVAGAPPNLKPLEIDQRGQPRATFTLLDNALLDSKSGDYEIPPRSMFYEHLKFTDATVHSVYLLNPIGANPGAEFMKVQVVQKIDGEWKAPEDWTHEPFKQFCLDKKSERLEEMLIIVSNSEVDRLSEKPFSIPKIFPMRISTSNVGCWKWQGQASSASTASVPFPTDDSARGVALMFEVASVLPGRIVFETTAGTIFGSMISTQGECTVTLDGASKTASRTPLPDGTIDVNLDLDLGFGGLGSGVDGPDRKFLKLSGLSTLTTLHKEVCPAFTLSSTGPQVWDWLHVDDPAAYQVSADGQTIEGRFTSQGAGVTINSIWKFTAVRE
ncbi:MAG: Ig-like domain-containing protein [Caldimonas sp.]